MASGSFVRNKFQRKSISGTSASISTHTSRSLSNSSAVSSYINDYYFVQYTASTSINHCLFGTVCPNPGSSSDTIMTIWNQNDGAKSPGYEIAGCLVPKALCRQL